MKTNYRDATACTGGPIKKRSVAFRFILYAACSGASFSVFKFNEAVASKSLEAGKLWITFITMCMPVANFTSLWWARLLVGRDQRRIVAWGGGIVFFCLVSALFLSHVAHLLLLFALSSIVIAMVRPAENRTLQQHITAGRRGRLFGKAKGLHMFTAACISFAAGWYMDIVEEGYCHIYAAAGVLSLAGFLFLASVPTGSNGTGKPEHINRAFFLRSIKKMFVLLKRRPDYLRFEGAFMLYGFAFTMSLPVVPLYLVEDLGFDYSEFGMTRAMVPQLIMAFGIPFFGKVFDRSTPHRMCSIFFMVLAVYPLFLILAGDIGGFLRLVMGLISFDDPLCIVVSCRLEGFLQLGIVFAAFGVLGVALSGVVLLWSLSSLRFAGNEDAGVYHSVHVAATGVRGLIGPFLGYFVMVNWGKGEALVCCFVLWTLASIMMMAARHWDIRSNQDHPLHVV